MKIPQNERHYITFHEGQLNPGTNLQCYFQISPTPKYKINDRKVETLFTLKDLFDFLAHFQPSRVSMSKAKNIFQLFFERKCLKIHIDPETFIISMKTKFIPPILYGNTYQVPTVKQLSEKYSDEKIPLL